MFRLDNKVAIVTGAGRGLGAATARMLARQGAHVAAADINFDEVEKVVAEIGNGSKAYAADVSNVTEINSLVEGVVRDFGHIDILVNNAGICPRLPFMESTEADWEKITRINAKSQYFLMQAVCPIMKKQGGRTHRKRVIHRGAHRWFRQRQHLQRNQGRHHHVQQVRRTRGSCRWHLS